MFGDRYEQEFNKLSKAFGEESGRHDIENQRIRTIIGYFDKMEALYLSNLKKLPAHQEKVFESIKAQTLNNMNIPASLHFYIVSFCSATKNIFSYNSNMAHLIQDRLIANLTEFLGKREELYNQQVDLYNTLSSQRAQVSQSRAKAQSVLVDAETKLKKISQDYQNNGKENQRAKENLLLAFRNYKVSLNNFEFETYRLNAIHTKSVKAIQEAIYKLHMDNAQMMLDLCAIFRQLTQMLKETADNFLTISDTINKSLSLSWENDFNQFLVDSKIARTSIPHVDFIPHTFTFDDPQLFSQHKSKRATLNIPISFAKVKHDFDSSVLEKNNININEKYILSLKEGEHVFAYDNANQPWVLVSKTSHGEKGYIPGSFLEFDARPTAIVKCAQIPLSDEYLSIEPSEIVVILNNNENEDRLLCENIQGKQGLIVKDCLSF